MVMMKETEGQVLWCLLPIFRKKKQKKIKLCVNYVIVLGSTQMK